jgi:hypothetical protein
MTKARTTMSSSTSISSSAKSLVRGQVAWRLGVSPRKYRELEAGDCSPDFETYDRICKLYGWPQTFVAVAGRNDPRRGGTR